MEDPSFLSHRGILTASLKVALEQNMAKGYFFRGGSTITQQLAKNLWLKRHKTVGRKVEEAFLTMALESCLTKTEILELYLNVVELGPDVYGIGPALKHYFNKGPGEMSLDEAYYLAGLLPRPQGAKPPYEGGLEQARKRMARLAANGLLDEDLVPTTENKYDISDWKTD
jgi:membrane peptidoglycan carboxypeptidase